MSRNSLQGQVALVTGAERGIGRAVALRLAADGAEVLVNYPAAAEGAQQVVEEILRGGGKARVVHADISKLSQVREMFAGIGALDILVNNAGTGVPGMLADITEDMVDLTVGVNIKGLIFCSQEAAIRMRAGGRIINFSSSTTRFPIPGMSVYTASKAAVKTFTEIWAKELGAQGITVNSVLPGPTSPGMADLAPPEVKEAVRRSSPFNRMGAADEIAAVVAFLCSEDARWISGEHILINGAAAA